MGLLPMRPNSLPPVARYTPACAPLPSFRARLAGPERSFSVDFSRSVITCSFLSGSLRAAETVDGPKGEYEYESGARGEGGGDVRRVAGKVTTGGFEDVGKRVEAGDGFDPTREQAERHEDRSQEQDEEDRGTYHRPGLLGAEQHRDTRTEKGCCNVGEDGEGDQAEEVEAAAYGHPREERDRGDQRPRQGGAHERGDRVSEYDPIPVGGGEQEPSGEAVLEVARDRKPCESPTHRDGLQEGPYVLEGDVAGRVVEARHVAHPRQATGEGDEEEQREERRGEECRIRKVLVDLAPGHGKRHLEESAHP